MQRRGPKRQAGHVGWETALWLYTADGFITSRGKLSKLYALYEDEEH